MGLGVLYVLLSILVSVSSTVCKGIPLETYNRVFIHACAGCTSGVAVWETDVGPFIHASRTWNPWWSQIKTIQWFIEDIVHTVLETVWSGTDKPEIVSWNLLNSIVVLSTHVPAHSICSVVRAGITKEPAGSYIPRSCFRVLTIVCSHR